MVLDSKLENIVVKRGQSEWKRAEKSSNMPFKTKKKDGKPLRTPCFEALFGRLENGSSLPPAFGVQALQLPKGMMMPPLPNPSGVRASGSTAGISSLKPAAGFECTSGAPWRPLKGLEKA